MKPKGWLRPLARECWALAPDWRKALGFMSVQANFIGASVVSAQMYAGVGQAWIYLTIVLWVALAGYGALVEQPELED